MKRADVIRVQWAIRVLGEMSAGCLSGTLAMGAENAQTLRGIADTISEVFANEICALQEMPSDEETAP